MTTSPGTSTHTDPKAPVHLNSLASIVADPTFKLADTVRALRAHGLPVFVRELADATPYGPDVDEL